MNILIKDILSVLPDGAETRSVYVSDGIIASISVPPEGFIADKTIEGKGKMLVSGLVNSHTHAGMTLFRNSADDMLLNDWLFNRIFPLEDKLVAEDVYWSVQLAVMEMLSSGTTAFIDMYYFTEEYMRALGESGIRCAYSRGLQGDISDKTTAESKLKIVLEEIERYKNQDRLTFMLAPHALYTCDEWFQREIAAAAKERGIPIHTHLAESPDEIETIKERFGRTPIEQAEKVGLLSETTVAAHCVHLTESDIELLATRAVNVATNPVSNLKLANGVAPVPKLLQAGINVAMGTDSAASNNTLNMFRELSMLSLVQKGINFDAQVITAKEALEIASRNGARAMGYDNLGEIAVGNIADLLIIDLDRPNMQPMNDPVAALAYSVNGSEVETVIVDGKVLMENREFLTIDKERVYYEIDKICERIGTR
ncbi:MAG: amidohydrolase [Oscillospiraceae bacterium]|nr:amidohydrolase [Oscillospiraceae bacterium]